MGVNPLNELPDFTPPPSRPPYLLIGGGLAVALIMVALVLTPPPSTSESLIAAGISPSPAITEAAGPLTAGGDPDAGGGVVITAMGSLPNVAPPPPSGAPDGAIMPSVEELLAVAPSAVLDSPIFQVETPSPTPSATLDPTKYTAPAYPIGGVDPAPGEGARSGGYSPFCVSEAGFPISVAMSTPLDAAFERIEREINVPALGAAVRFPDGSTWSRGVGSISIEGDLPATSGSAFAFASITKPSIGAVILLMAERGQIRLTDRVVDLLPGALIHPEATVANLMAHRSGLGDYLDAWPTESAMGRNPGAVLDPADYLYAGGAYGAPGDFYYSNSGYVLLAQIIERHYPSWIEAVRSEILDPAGACSIYAPGLDGTRPGMARGYYPAGGGWRPTGGENAFGPAMSILSVSGAAGGLVGTPADLTRMGAAIFGSDLLRDSTREVALSRWAGSYGLLGFRYYVDGRTVYGHGGRLGGARSQLFYDQASGITVAVAYSVADPDPNTAAAIILRAALEALGTDVR